MTGDKANFDGLAAAALQHHRAGRLAEAEAAYRAALQLVPGHPAVAHNLGAVAATRGDPESAIGWFDVALAAEPGYASALFNKAIALQTLGRMQAAIACLKRTCALEPEHYQAHLRLALLWLAEGERGRALDHFARTYELRRGEDRSGLAGRSLSHATRGKLLHDADQFRYLASRRRDGQRFEVLARLYEDVARGLPDGVAELSPAQLDVLGEDYNSGIHLADAAEIRGPAVNPALDVNAIERAFRDGGAGAAAVDDLLTPDALASLKRYLLESTIWHDFSHIGGFVASYLEDGLASPLVLQIADELRRALPDLLGPHPLSQAWAFKGLEARSEVDAHADDAVVSVNLWLTPDTANLESEGGGLQVCTAPPPAHWRMTGYDADMAEIAAFLERHRDDTIHVPYRENRAVIFHARLFHRSDAPRFAAGYANHRVNLTLLYGRDDE